MRNEMNQVRTIPLIDVISLSRIKCSTPIEGDLKYSYQDNFIGRPIVGYCEHSRDICLLAPQAAHMLCDVQNYLVEHHHQGLLIFDAYRPLRAVNDFIAWFTHSPTEAEIIRKSLHYPTLTKTDLAPQGYIADKISNHCYGQAVDLTLLDLEAGTELDMGTCFDYFDDLSHSTQDEQRIGTLAYQNRMRLIQAMHMFNFKVHSKEYWHFDYHIRENSEPLDVVINESLRGLGLSLAPAAV